MMNILLRFAVSRNLSIALPKTSNYLGKMHIDPSRLVPFRQGHDHYDILCNHVVFSRDTVRATMPGDTTYIAIVRQPWQQILSAFLYYKGLNVSYITRCNGPQMIYDYLGSARYYESRAGTASYTNNRMSCEFGLEQKHVRNTTFIHEYIQKLDLEFGLVLIIEYFDESVVLLRRGLCWNAKDVIYIELNANKAKRAHVTLGADDFARHK
jgi:galactosylceramide sulfotransferase